jgi:hypothetical protein
VKPLDMSSKSRFLARAARRPVVALNVGPGFTIIYAAAGLVIVVFTQNCLLAVLQAAWDS